MTSQQLEQQAGQLRRLAAELNTAEQRLRRQLAEALHDHLQQLLVSARMRVEWAAGRAADGKEAVDLIDEASPDVVIMDMAMPRMDGVEATKQITKHWPDIRVVGLSMHSSKDMADVMIKAGASDFLAKGGASKGLVDAIFKAARGTGSG